jgi:hypothetical protein
MLLNSHDTLLGSVLIVDEIKPRNMNSTSTNKTIQIKATSFYSSSTQPLKNPSPIPSDDRPFKKSRIITSFTSLLNDNSSDNDQAGTVYILHL